MVFLRGVGSSMVQVLSRPESRVNYNACPLLSGHPTFPSRRCIIQYSPGFDFGQVRLRASRFWRARISERLRFIGWALGMLKI